MFSIELTENMHSKNNILLELMIMWNCVVGGIGLIVVDISVPPHPPRSWSLVGQRIP